MKTLYDGVAMTEAQLHKVFEKYDIARFKAEGEPFDPNMHSAVMEMPAEKEEHKAGHIGLVIKNGFTIAGRTLRPAEVGVIKK